MSTTRDEIIAIALRLIRQKNYSSFSYDDISRELGITKAAIHYHFKAKEDLGLAVCDFVRGELLARHRVRLEEVRNGRHPWSIIEERANNAAQCGICPMVSLQSDFANLPGVLQEGLRRLVETELECFCALIEAYNAKADCADAVTPFLAFKGAMQYRRTMGEGFYQKSIKNIRKQFYCAVPEPLVSTSASARR